MIDREWYRSDTVLLRWYLQYNDTQGVIQVIHCDTAVVPTIQWYTGSDTGQTMWYCDGTCNTMIHREWYRSDTVLLRWYLQYNDTQGVIQVRHCDTAVVPAIQWYTWSDTGQTLWYCGDTCNTMIHREWYRSDTVILQWYLQYNDRQGVIQVRHCDTAVIPATQWYTGSDTGQTLWYCGNTCNTVIHREWYRSDIVIMRWYLQYNDTQGVIQVRHCDTAVVPTIQWYTGSDTGQSLWYCGDTYNTMIHREWYRSDTVILRWYLQYSDTQGVIQVRHCDTAVVPTIQWYTGSDTGQTLCYCDGTCNTMIHREWYRSDTVILRWYLQYNDTQGVIQVRHCDTAMIPTIQWYTGSDTGQTLWYCGDTCNTVIHREWYRSDTVILLWYLQYNDRQGVIQVRHCDTAVVPTIEWYTGSDTGQTLWYCGGTYNTVIHREWYRSDTVIPTIQWYTGSDTGQTLWYCGDTGNTMIHTEWYRSDTVILLWYLQYNDTHGVIQVRHCDTAVVPTIEWYTGSDTGQTLWYCGGTYNTVIHREWYRSDTVILRWYLQYNDTQGVIHVRHCDTAVIPAIQWYKGSDTGQTLWYCDGTCNTMIHREWYRSDTVLLRWYLQYNDTQGVIQVRHCDTAVVPTIQWYTGSDTGQTLWYCGGTCNTMIHSEWYRSDTVILRWYLQYNDTQGVIQVRHCDTAVIPAIQLYKGSDTGQTLWYCGDTCNRMIHREWYRSDTVILRWYL